MLESGIARRFPSFASHRVLPVLQFSRWCPEVPWNVATLTDTPPAQAEQALVAAPRAHCVPVLLRVLRPVLPRQPGHSFHPRHSQGRSSRSGEPSHPSAPSCSGWARISSACPHRWCTQARVAATNTTTMSWCSACLSSHCWQRRCGPCSIAAARTMPPCRNGSGSICASAWAARCWSMAGSRLFPCRCTTRIYSPS